MTQSAEPPGDAASEDKRIGHILNTLIDRIEGLGIPVGPRDRMRAGLAVLRLALQRRWTGDESAMSRAISPLFARNADEQQRICRLAETRAPASHAATSTEARVKAAAPRKAPRRMIRLVTVGVALAALAAIVAWMVWTNLPESASGEPSTPPPNLGSAGLPEFMKKIEVPELAQQPWPNDRTLRWYYTEYTPLKFAAVLIPFAVAALFLWWLWTKLAEYLYRRDALHFFAEERLQLKAHAISLVDRRLVARAVQRIRYRPEPAALEIDVSRTVQRTVERAGLPELVTQARLTSAPHLILIDRRSRHDHMAEIFHLLIAAVKDSGVHIEVWEFSGDPRHLSGPGGRRDSLRDLIRGRPDWRLVLLSDGDSFIDPVTGRLAAWATIMRHAETRALMTPRPRRLWGGIEATLERELMLRIEEATAEGIMRLGERSPGQAPTIGLPVDRLAAVRRLDMLLQSRPLLWTGQVRPTNESMRELIDTLEAALDPDALTWLRALAVFPALRFEITLRLGELTQEEETPEALRRRLFSIARLPWLREGRIPEWLRKALVRGMTADEDARVRRVLSSGSDDSNGPQLQLMRRDTSNESAKLQDGVLLDFLFGLRALRGLRVQYLSRLRELLRLRRVRQFLAVTALGTFAAATSAGLTLSVLPLHACDALATDVYDFERVGAGIDRSALPLRSGALAACEEAVATDPENGRWQYQLALARAVRQPSSVFAETMETAARLGHDMALYRYAMQNLFSDSGKDVDWALKQLKINDPLLFEDFWSGYYHYHPTRRDRLTALDHYKKAGSRTYLAGWYWALRETGDHDRAVSILRNADVSNDPAALNILGFLSDTVIADVSPGVIELNKVSAAKLFEKSAVFGREGGLFNSAITKMAGDSIEKDPEAACVAMIQSAFLGKTNAFRVVGEWVIDGKCTSPVSAEAWYAHAATNGIATAQLRLADLYRYGQENHGIAADLAKAAEHYRMVIANDKASEDERSTATQALKELE